MRKGLAAVVFLVLVVLLLGACAKATPAPTPRPTAAPTPVATPAPPAKPTPEGVLRIGKPDWSGAAVDPYAGDMRNKNQIVLVFDYLVGATPDRSDLSPAMGLAQKWEQSPDLLSWTFYLRKGVQFDKGWGEATAEDVKFSLERLTRAGSLASYAQVLRDIIKNIEAVDPYTVRIDLKSPFIVLPFYLSPMYGTEAAIVPKKYIEKVGDKEFALNPIGSGPYRFVKYEVGLYLKFEGRDDYWALGVPRYKEIYLYIVPEESTRVAMLKKGELDVTEVTLARVKELEAAGFKVYEKKGSLAVFAYIHNQWEGAHTDIRVRQALNMAVNKEEMLKTLFQGKGSVLPGGQPTWIVGAKFNPPVPYNPQKAKDLLAEAGYPKGYDLTLIQNTLDPLPIVTQALAGYYEAVGIKTKIVLMDLPAAIAKWRAGELKNTLLPNTNPNRPGSYSAGFQYLYHSKSTAGMIRDPKLDAMIDAASGARSLAELAESQGKIQQYLYENHSTVWLVEIGEYYAVSPKVELTLWSAGGKSTWEVGLTELWWRRP